MMTSKHEPPADTPVSARSRFWRRILMCGALLLLALLFWYCIGIFKAIYQAEQLGAAAASEEEFQQQLNETNDPRLQQTMQELRGLLTEAEEADREYEARETAVIEPES